MDEKKMVEDAAKIMSSFEENLSDEIDSFEPYVVIEDSMTHRTSWDGCDGIEISKVCMSYNDAIDHIKEKCQESVDMWSEFRAGKRQEFFSNFGIFKLVAQVKPTLDIIAKIGYPIVKSD